MMFVGPVPRLPLRSRVLDQGPIWRDAAVFVSLSSLRTTEVGRRTTDDFIRCLWSDLWFRACSSVG